LEGLLTARELFSEKIVEIVPKSVTDRKDFIFAHHDFGFAKSLDLDSFDEIDIDDLCSSSRNVYKPNYSFR
jgi:hypothetical protein